MGKLKQLLVDTNQEEVSDEQKAWDFITKGGKYPFPIPKEVKMPIESKPLIIGRLFCRECGNPTNTVQTICQYCIPEDDRQMLAEQEGDEEREG